MAAGAVPVAGDGLGVEGDGNVVELGDAEEDVAAHPQVVAHGDADAGANLVLPLHTCTCPRSIGFNKSATPPPRN